MAAVQPHYARPILRNDRAEEPEPVSGSCLADRNFSKRFSWPVCGIFIPPAPTADIGYPTERTTVHSEPACPRVRQNRALPVLRWYDAFRSPAKTPFRRNNAGWHPLLFEPNPQSEGFIRKKLRSFNPILFRRKIAGSRRCMSKTAPSCCPDGADAQSECFALQPAHERCGWFRWESSVSGRSAG
jgi:hypothetical protein